MREFSVFSALWRAPLFSRRLFQDAALNWKGIGTRYLMLILLITWLPLFIKWTVKWSTIANHDAPAALKEFPPLTFRGGHVSSPVEQPYVFTDNRGTPIFALDTTVKIVDSTGKPLSPRKYGAPLLITDNSLIEERAPGMMKVNPLAGFPDMTIDAPIILSWITWIRNMMLPIFFPACWAFALGWRLFSAVLLATIGLGFASMFRGQLSFAALLRLSALSMTTTLYVAFVLWFVPIHIGLWTFLLYPAISLGYLAFAVNAAAEVTRPAAPAFPVEFPPPAPPPAF